MAALGVAVLAAFGAERVAIAEDAPSGEPATVVETGVVQALSCLTVTAQQRGQVAWVVDEGKQVAKGEPVIEFEHEEQVRQLEDLDVQLQEAKAQVSELEDGFADQKKELEAEVEAAQSTLELANFREKLLVDGATPAQRAEAQARLDRAAAAATVATEQWERAQGLLKRGVLSQDEAHATFVASERARFDHRLALVNRNLLIKAPEPVERRRAKLDIEVATLEVAVARERLAAQVEQLKRGIDDAKLRVVIVEDEMRRVKRRIDRSILRAPGAGIAVRGMVGHGRKRKVEIGSRVWPGTSLITLPDFSALKVNTQVGEEVVGNLRVGMRLPVRVNTIDDRAFTGEIIRIDIWGQDRNELLDDTGKRAEGLYGAKVYAVDVKIVERDPRVTVGAQASVRFPKPTAAPEVTP